ncbi:hypothetical protein FRC09_004823 [Ceratobasidium sp. 395]|nr:hypothetical protein FRC09_004823 [Ceratobasidium sp. 395]
MAATKENPIIFYDVASKDGSYWSCNTIKTRLTLNYKGLPYRVQYIHLNEVQSALKSLGVPPASKTPPYYTLPSRPNGMHQWRAWLTHIIFPQLAIADPSSDPNGEPIYVSETFAISAYLDDKYPAPRYPTVFTPGTRPLQRLFVDNFTANIGGPLFQLFIRPYFPQKYLTEAALDYLLRSRSTTVATYAHLKGDEATSKLVEVRQKWETLAEAFNLNATEGSTGPFMMGNKITFADFAVGGMLFALNRAEGDDGQVWQEVMKWSDGKWSGYWKEIKDIKDEKSAQLA